uniref:Uncharacterized protein n=1 Tax=Rhizophora mucronata TaxID=61149 RepID=A0A2P2R227_RHIMU
MKTFHSIPPPRGPGRKKLTRINKTFNC